MKDVAGEEGLIPPDLHYTDFEKYIWEIQLRNTFEKYSYEISLRNTVGWLIDQYHQIFIIQLRITFEKSK